MGYQPTEDSYEKVIFIGATSLGFLLSMTVILVFCLNCREKKKKETAPSSCGDKNTLTRIASNGTMGNINVGFESETPKKIKRKSVISIGPKSVNGTLNGSGNIYTIPTEPIHYTLRNNNKRLVILYK